MPWPQKSWRQPAQLRLDAFRSLFVAMDANVASSSKGDTAQENLPAIYESWGLRQ